MKSLIVLYSKTGNTLGVAEKIKDVLKCDLEQVKAKSDEPNEMKPELVVIPDITKHDHLIFATPVHGFSISRIMRAYLEQLPDLSGKTIDLFVTHLFPFAWMGGNSTLKQMRKIILSKNGSVRHMTSVNWKSKKKQQVIEDLINSYK